MVGSWKARAAPVNVNYRYVAEELTHVLADSAAAVVVYQGCFAERLAEVLPAARHRAPAAPGRRRQRRRPAPRCARLRGRRWRRPPALEPDRPLPRRPLRALHRRHHRVPQGRAVATGRLPREPRWASSGATAPTSSRSTRWSPGPAATGCARCPRRPFMHGAAHWNALSTWLSGGTVIIQDHVDRFDAADVLDTCDAARRHLPADRRRRLRPTARRRARRATPTSCPPCGTSSPAARSSPARSSASCSTSCPGCGSSTCWARRSPVGRASGARRPPRPPARRTSTRDADLGGGQRRPTTVLDPGDDELGWLAHRGRVPRGYLGDEAKTAAHLPGDRRRSATPSPATGPGCCADGSIELHGRDSVTINSGGEKIFAEEVEQALKHHPDVYDALVVGRPSERWGQEVVAVVAAPRRAPRPPPRPLVAEAAEHVARYKLPKAIVFVDRRAPQPQRQARLRRGAAARQRRGLMVAVPLSEMAAARTHRLACSDPIERAFPPLGPVAHDHPPSPAHLAPRSRADPRAPPQRRRRPHHPPRRP